MQVVTAVCVVGDVGASGDSGLCGGGCWCKW